MIHIQRATHTKDYMRFSVSGTVHTLERTPAGVLLDGKPVDEKFPEMFGSNGFYVGEAFRTGKSFAPSGVTTARQVK